MQRNHIRFEMAFPAVLSVVGTGTGIVVGRFRCHERFRKIPITVVHIILFVVLVHFGQTEIFGPTFLRFRVDVFSPIHHYVRKPTNTKGHKNRRNETGDPAGVLDGRGQTKGIVIDPKMDLNRKEITRP